VLSIATEPSNDHPRRETPRSETKERATGSNPYDQLGRLVARSGRSFQLAAVTSRYPISKSPRCLFG